MSPKLIEELEGRLREPAPVHDRVRLLNSLAEALQERDAERGATLALEAVELARATGDTAGEAQALYCLGRNHYARADYPLVFETQSEALALFRKLDDPHGEARVHNLLGITHRQLGDCGRALEFYDLALKGFRDAGDRKWQARVMSNVGNVEIQLGNHGAALELFEQALALRREVGDHEGAGFDLNNAAFGHIQRALQMKRAGDDAGCQSESETALRLLDRGLAIARQYGFRRLEAFCLQTLGEAYQAMSRPEVALAMADDFVAAARHSNDRWIEAYGRACVGELRHQTGQGDRAVADLEAALATFEALGAEDQVARVLRILSQVREALEDYAGALAAVRRAGAIEDRLRTEEAESRARALATRRRLDQARLEAERYRRLSLEDALTGLANRRHLDERLQALARDATKSKRALTLALADVDHFKGINDRFSHAVGDEVLRCVGEILRRHCRVGDVAGRYGGEEFMLVFRDLDMRGAAEICERVRRSVEGFDWPSIHPQLRVTLSMGLASNVSFDDPQHIVDTADHWLYEAKHHGRNQVQPLVVAPG